MWYHRRMTGQVITCFVILNIVCKNELKIAVNKCPLNLHIYPTL